MEFGMTDFQFRSVLKMLLKIAKDSRDIEAVIRAIQNLIDGKDIE